MQTFPLLVPSQQSLLGTACGLMMKDPSKEFNLPCRNESSWPQCTPEEFSHECSKHFLQEHWPATKS